MRGGASAPLPPLFAGFRIDNNGEIGHPFSMFLYMNDVHSGDSTRMHKGQAGGRNFLLGLPLSFRASE